MISNKIVKVIILFCIILVAILVFIYFNNRNVSDTLEPIDIKSLLLSKAEIDFPKISFERKINQSFLPENIKSFISDLSVYVKSRDVTLVEINYSDGRKGYRISQYVDKNLENTFREIVLFVRSRIRTVLLHAAGSNSFAIIEGGFTNYQFRISQNFVNAGSHLLIEDFIEIK